MGAVVCAVFFFCLPAHLDRDVRAGARLGRPALCTGPAVPSLSSSTFALYANNQNAVKYTQTMFAVLISVCISSPCLDHSVCGKHKREEKQIWLEKV